VYTDDGSQVISPPTSHDEMMALVAQRRAVTERLDPIPGRRDDIVSHLRGAPEPAQAGMQAELKLLDQQVIVAQTDLANVERAISQTSNSELISMAQERDEPQVDNNGSFEDGMAAGGFSVLFLMSALPFPGVAEEGGTRQPLMPARNRSGCSVWSRMDAMAVEIEVSEGQRFVTRLMTDRAAPSQRLADLLLAVTVRAAGETPCRFPPTLQTRDRTTSRRPIRRPTSARGSSAPLGHFQILDGTDEVGGVSNELRLHVRPSGAPKCNHQRTSCSDVLTNSVTGKPGGDAGLLSQQRLVGVKRSPSSSAAGFRESRRRALGLQRAGTIRRTAMAAMRPTSTCRARTRAPW
jgi:hypothetical protein